MSTGIGVPVEPCITTAIDAEAVEAIRAAISSRAKMAKEKSPFFSLCDVAIERKTKRYVGFQTVYALRQLKPIAPGSNEDETEQYSLRHLQRGIMNSATGKAAIESLLTECTLLSRLEPHPNIVQLVAFQEASSAGPIVPHGIDGQFFVTEHIVETLDDRLSSCRQKSRSPSSQQSVNERLQVVVDVASALQQIHGNSFVYFVRPGKIGFDSRGRTKLFDFGDCQKSRLIGHRLSCSDHIETLAYTAPEVFLLEPIGCSADVYGLAIIAWEIISLRKPFHGYSRPQHFAEAVISDKRPSLQSIDCVFTMSELLKQCWAAKKRPSVESLQRKLKTILRSHNSESGRTVLKRHKSECDAGHYAECMNYLETESSRQRDGNSYRQEIDSLVSRRVKRSWSSDASQFSKGSASSMRSVSSGKSKEKSAKLRNAETRPKEFFDCSQKQAASMELWQYEPIGYELDTSEKQGKHVRDGSDNCMTEKSRIKESDNDNKTRRRQSIGRLTDSIGGQVTNQSRPLRLRRRQSTGRLLGQAEEGNSVFVKAVADNVWELASSLPADTGDFGDLESPIDDASIGVVTKRGDQLAATKNFESKSDTTKNAAALDCVVSSYGPSQSASSRSVSRSQSDDAIRDRCLLDMRQMMAPKEAKAHPSNVTLLQLRASLDQAKANLAPAPKPEKRNIVRVVRRLSLSGRKLMDDVAVNETPKPVKKQQTRRSSLVADLSSEYTSSKSTRD